MASALQLSCPSSSSNAQLPLRGYHGATAHAHFDQRIDSGPASPESTLRAGARHSAEQREPLCDTGYGTGRHGVRRREVSASTATPALRLRLATATSSKARLQRRGKSKAGKQRSNLGHLKNTHISQAGKMAAACGNEGLYLAGEQVVQVLIRRILTVHVSGCKRRRGSKSCRGDRPW